MKFRPGSPEDGSQILEIYAQYINTPVTFEYTLPSGREFSRRIDDICRFYPYIVCEEENRIVAYAYAHRHMERAAYQWNAELSVYMDRSFRSKGLGKKLYIMLMEILKLQGVKTVYGGVTAPNPRSEALHNSLGFSILGTYHNAGYKEGKWHDVLWFEKAIGQYDIPPQPIISIRHIPQMQIHKIMSSVS